MPLVSRTSNQGNLYKEATTPPNWLDGDLWSDTTANSVKVNVGGIATAVGATSFSSSAVVSSTSTIGDYTDPVAAVASSTGSASSSALVVTVDPTNDSGNPINNGTQTAVGYKAETSQSVLIGKTINGCGFKLYKLGTISGTGYFRVYNGAGTLMGTFGTLDISTITETTVGTAGWYTAQGGYTHTIIEDDRIVFYSDNGDASNRVLLAQDGAGSFDTNYTTRTVLAGTWAEGGSGDVPAMELYELSPNVVYDDNTSTHWQSNAEVNPKIYVDGAAAKNFLGLAIWLHANNTETEIAVRCSTDTTFTSGENTRTILATSLTAGAWNYIRFNLVNARYIEIYGNSGSSLVLAISEIKYLTKTDSQVLADLGILEISATDTSLSLDGI